MGREGVGVSLALGSSFFGEQSVYGMRGGKENSKRGLPPRHTGNIRNFLKQPRGRMALARRMRFALTGGPQAWSGDLRRSSGHLVMVLFVWPRMFFDVWVATAGVPAFLFAAGD